MNAPVRVAAVGLGWVCQNRHLPVMGRSADYQVVGVIDRTEGRAREIAQRNSYEFHSQASGLSAVPWLDEVDAITVSTAPMAHFDLISEAVARGKHVLTEKPFVMTSEEGTRLVEAANKSDRRLAIVHNF